jgi:hypothetical protein
MIEYIIKTYSNEGETVLDMTCHSTVVGDVVVGLQRNYIGVDIEPMEVEPAAGGDAGAGSGGGGSSAAAATQAMSPPAPVSPAPAPAPAPAQSTLEQQMAQLMARQQQMELDNQQTNQRLKAAEDRAKAAEAKLDQVSEKRKKNDRDDSSVTDSDKARTAGLLKGKKGVKPTPTVTDNRNRD